MDDADINRNRTDLTYGNYEQKKGPLFALTANSHRREKKGI